MNDKLAFRWKQHLLFWSVFIIYELCVSYNVAGKFGHPVEYILPYVVNIGFFYIHTYLVLDLSFNNSRKSFLLLICLIIAEITAFLAIKYEVKMIFVAMGIQAQHAFEGWTSFVITSIWRLVYFTGLGTTYWFYRRTVRHQAEMAGFENQRLQEQLAARELEKRLFIAQNAYLQSQINPHFLFNTLTFLHSGIMEYSLPLAESTLQLADMMRYAFKEPDSNGTIALAEEAQQIENLIELNQGRFERKLQIHFVFESDNNNYRIIPLVLLTLVENIFKYGDLFLEKHPAKVSVNANRGVLAVSIFNKKNRQGDRTHSGVGLDNLRKRIAIHYGEQYQLFIDEQNDSYFLNLSLTLK